MDCIIHGVTKSRTRLSDFHFHFGTPKTDFTDGALREVIAADSQEVVEETVSASKETGQEGRSCKTSGKTNATAHFHCPCYSRPRHQES